nr:hypothetical protein [Tanacetum cinerariifolium]
MDVANENVVNDPDQPQDDLELKTDNAPKHNWFKQPPQPLTPDPECNKGKSVDDAQEQTWSQINKFSKHDVYLTHKIHSMVSVKINKLHGCHHLEEIVVRRANHQLYKFKEGKFMVLHLNDIEDMLLLVAQHKLFNLYGNDIVDLAVTLRMFTRSLIIKRRVEDVQLGVGRVVYEDLNKQKRVMRADELYMFSDETLKLVCDELHHRVLNFRLGYNKEMLRRKWLAIDKRRSELMVELIDKQMRERMIIKNLKRLVGAQKLKMDYRLMTHTT